MSAKDLEGRPPYPHPPPGLSRMGHLPTVELSIRYWEAIRREAVRLKDFDRERTATGLRRSYEEARRDLLEAARRSARGRPDPS
jgi:hypothetical protein